MPTHVRGSGLISRLAQRAPVGTAGTFAPPMRIFDSVVYPVRGKPFALLMRSVELSTRDQTTDGDHGCATAVYGMIKNDTCIIPSTTLHRREHPWLAL